MYNLSKKYLFINEDTIIIFPNEYGAWRCTLQHIIDLFLVLIYTTLGITTSFLCIILIKLYLFMYNFN